MKLLVTIILIGYARVSTQDQNLDLQIVSQEPGRIRPHSLLLGSGLGACLAYFIIRFLN